MSARTLIEEYYRVVWTEGDLDAIERFFAPGATAGGILPPTPLAAEDLRVMAQAVRAIIRRPRFEIARLVETGDWAAALCVVEGTVVATGEPIRIEGQVMFRHEGDRFVEAHNAFDMLGPCTEIGALPPDALPRILGGERFA